MADEWHVKWLAEGVEKWNRRRKRVSFRPDFAGLRFFDVLPEYFRDKPKSSRYFEKIDLSNANLAGAHLSDLNFQRASFRGATLRDADLSMSNFTGANFIDADLQAIDARNAILDEAKFSRANLADANFAGAVAMDAVFIATNLSTTQLSELGDSRVRLYATERAYDNERVVAFSEPSAPKHAADRDDGPTPKDRYDVYFGTNRNPVYEQGALINFGKNRAAEVSFGICEVIIPPGHRMGSIGSSLIRRLWNRKDDRLRTSDIISLNEDLFWKHLASLTAKVKIRERPTLFVHGFNTSFDDAVLRAAQIGYDVGLNQGIGLFSWPSRRSILKYSADAAAADASAEHLAKFIVGFIGSSEHQSVNIIAHSMGCRCVLGALDYLSQTDMPSLQKVNQIILAAADVDAGVMPRIARHAIASCSRATSYVSDKDKALKISGWLQSFPRVGITPPTFILSGLDTIVVNDLSLGDFSHGYLGTSRTVLSDIFNLLRFNTPPEERHAIEKIAEDGNLYWKMKN